MHVHSGRIALPPDLQRHEVVYRRLGAETEPVLGCGTFVHPRGDPGKVRFHRPQACSVVLLLRGGGWYRDEVGIERRLAPGDLVVRIPGRHHSTLADDDGQWLEFFLHFPVSLWQALVEVEPALRDEPVWRPGLQRDLLLRCVDLRQRMHDRLIHPHAAIIAEMVALVVELRARHHAAAGTPVDPLAEAEALLLARLDQHLPPEAVAARVGLPWETFRKRFHQRTGMGPAAYRKLARLRHASILLTSHELPVATVAAMVGYGDTFAFSKAFRRWSGHAPSQHGAAD
jgi:AraC-like DNA-binding protein/quercetin dioxygenase-like cupin family protein